MSFDSVKLSSLSVTLTSGIIGTDSVEQILRVSWWLCVRLSLGATIVAAAVVVVLMVCVPAAGHLCVCKRSDSYIAQLTRRTRTARFTISEVAVDWQ